jgi:hypothetical protein
MSADDTKSRRRSNYPVNPDARASSVLCTSPAARAGYWDVMRHWMRRGIRPATAGFGQKRISN